MIQWGWIRDKTYLWTKLGQILLEWTFYPWNKIEMPSFWFGDNLDYKFIPRGIPFGWTGDKPFLGAKLDLSKTGDEPYIWLWLCLSFNFGSFRPQIHPQKNSSGLNSGGTIIWSQSSKVFYVSQQYWTYFHVKGSNLWSLDPIQKYVWFYHF